jgi:hypothetical protein
MATKRPKGLPSFQHCGLWVFQAMDKHYGLSMAKMVNLTNKRGHSQASHCFLKNCALTSEGATSSPRRFPGCYEAVALSQLRGDGGDGAPGVLWPQGPGMNPL